MFFLMWYDDSPKKTAVEKIQEAVAAYAARFTIPPDLVLVNVIDHADVEGVVVRSVCTVKPNNFWVGQTESA